MKRKVLVVTFFYTFVITTRLGYEEEYPISPEALTPAAKGGVVIETGYMEIDMDELAACRDSLPLPARWAGRRLIEVQPIPLTPGDTEGAANAY